MLLQQIDILHNKEHKILGYTLFRFFPRKICHVHYPMLAPIVRETAKEFGITYMENKYFSDAFMSHVRTLKRFGVATVEFG